MAYVSDDEDMNLARQRFQHPDDADDMDMNSDAESDQEAEEDAAAQGRPQRRDRMPLHMFLRLIGGGRVLEREVASSNDELVLSLKRSGIISQDAAIQAMRACPRDHFITEAHQDEAFSDSPVRLEDLDFNVSAPHMHASCLEALQLQPGQHVLDVGTGCGIIAACAAHIVGKAGLPMRDPPSWPLFIARKSDACKRFDEKAVKQLWHLQVGTAGLSVGIDIRQAAVKLASSNIKRLRANSTAFASQASHCKLELHNVFMPASKHRGQYDRVHVGASCPPDRLNALLSLLRPSGGKIVTPVSPNDMRVISVDDKGDITQRVISQVRYGELEIPSDAEIVIATLRMKRKEQTAIPKPPSTYAQDIVCITSLSGSSSSSGSSGSDQSSFMAAAGASKGRTDVESSDGSGSGSSSGQGSPTNRIWPRRVAKFLSSCSGNLGSSGKLDDMALPAQRSQHSVQSVSLDPAELGPTDLVLVGNGWTIPVHRHVLENRSDHCRARHDSGMRDAEDKELQVPEHFSKEAIDSFLHYLYWDNLDPRTSPQHAVAVLHVAHYYGATRLVTLCEAILAKEIKKGDGDDEGTHEAAAALLALADESGLARLKAVCLDYILHHYSAVAATEAYKGLTGPQRDLIAAEACASYAHLRGVLKEVACRKTLPDN